MSRLTSPLFQPVRLSTIRTQIGQLRQKSGVHSIHELIERVTSLPPILTEVP